MISKSFYESLDAIADERGLAIGDILTKVQLAMAICCKNSDVPYKGEIKIECDEEKKRIRFFNCYHVVDVVDPDGDRGQITLEDALKKKTNVKIGSEIREEINLALFKRKAVSMFRQNLLSELKSLEREEAYKYFSDKTGSLFLARVVGVNDKYVVFNLEKDMRATMSYRDALPNEEFKVGDEKRVYLVKVEKTTKGPRLYLSRNNKKIVQKVFEEHIPEIAKGLVKIGGIARDAGSRSKIGVFSVNSDVDPKGACVGAGGSRIRAINDALDGEKIDIFLWKDDPVSLIAEALSPAKALSVILKPESKQSIVIVADDQFSLAIGKNGQNTRLAAIATGWKIDIKKLSDAEKEAISFTPNVH